MKKFIYVFFTLALFFNAVYGLTDNEIKFLKSCEEGKYDSVVSLINRKVNINVVSEDGVTGLMLASHHGHSAIVRLLVNSKADVNIADKVGYTALIMAVTGGYADIAKILLKASADVNAKDKNGRTALTYIKENYKKPETLIAFLNEYGATE